MGEESPYLFAMRSGYKFDPRSLVGFLLSPSLLELLDLSTYPYILFTHTFTSNKLISATIHLHHGFQQSHQG